MYVFFLDMNEQIIKTNALEAVQWGLEAKQTKLKSEGKDNEQLQNMIDVIQQSVTYQRQLFEFAEKKGIEVGKVDLKHRQALEKIKELENN